jgi:hypothetical protein
MNNIGVGIMCFGHQVYYNSTFSKVKNFIDNGIRCYVLTENVDFFKGKFDSDMLTLLPYNKSIKSYHDKVLIIKEIIKYHEIAILVDADTILDGYTFLHNMKEFEFEKGISYLSSLENHECKYGFIKNIQMDPENVQWHDYRKYVEKLLPEFGELETIWEYYIVVNKDGFNSDEFFNYYEKLQIVKEYCDLLTGKNKIIGAAEGVSVHIAAKLSNSQIQKDENLHNLLRYMVLPTISPRFIKQ